jgi:hypothetical protein
MKEFSRLTITEAISEIECSIAERKHNAGMNGEFGDGGAFNLKEKLIIFETMWDGKPLPESRVPEFIKPILVTVEKTHDPEYQKYLELKQKFELW